MNIPTIGGARGIFEYFVPGIFLLINFGLSAYFFPYTNDETKRGILAAASNPALAVIVGVSFGYLIGVVLRLFQTDLPDRLSAAWLRRFHRKARQHDRKFSMWAVEQFPYFGWLEQSCQLYLPAEALDFYRKTWGRRKQGEQNKQFVTFMKALINSGDARAADEMYAAESLSRYIAGMFYALCFACVSILVTIITSYLASGSILMGLSVLLFSYLFAIASILAHYRFIRIKEVEIVFAASFRNRILLEEAISKGKNTTTSASKQHLSKTKS
ncbi:MAG TPA: hypothetical protein VFR47_00225 [Anaerolineales bacterium]|nr:hypothetical protein [Anaerolineales bacterium]